MLDREVLIVVRSNHDAKMTRSSTAVYKSGDFSNSTRHENGQGHENCQDVLGRRREGKSRRGRTEFCIESAGRRKMRLGRPNIRLKMMELLGCLERAIPLAFCRVVQDLEGAVDV